MIVKITSKINAKLSLRIPCKKKTFIQKEMASLNTVILNPPKKNENFFYKNDIGNCPPLASGYSLPTYLNYTAILLIP